MRRRRSRGIALVAVTMAVAVLSVVAVTIARTATTGDRMASTAAAVAQAEALARSGVAAARAALGDAARADVPDTLRAPWLRPLDPQALGDGVLVVTVEDEARRLDLDGMPDALPRLLARAGLDPRLADAIADWTDADDVARTHGAERAYYRALVPPREPANRPFGSVGELLLVRGVDPAILERLRPLVTVAGEDGVNPNTASPDVMLAAWPDPGRVGTLLAARERGAVECGDLPHCTTRSRVYTVRATGRVGAIGRIGEAVVRALPGVDAEIVAWRWAATPPRPARRSAAGAP
jgi:general secretion pathway protein K